MIYLWVAIGGALGSVARFWLNNAVAAALGAEFPWGTLLINVIGSFVISFFGTLTGKLARFAVPPEISIFVMVGICGGFTTFSSFSLQTVQLARAGEWDRAIWYVLASVILCVMVCWLGVIAALAVPGRAVDPAAVNTTAQAGALAPATGASNRPLEGRPVLALLPNAENTANLLDSAQALATIFGSPLAALHVRIDPETSVIPSAEVLTQPAAVAITQTQTNLQAAVAREVADWQARTGAKLTFLEPFGSETLETARVGADAAAIVAPLPRQRNLAQSAMNTAIFDTGRPVLVLPEGAVFRPSGHVAIGWKDIAHARAAIAAAMPVIAQAQQITLIAIGDPGKLRTDHALALLGEHAARAQVINPPRDNRKVGDQLLAEAKAHGAGALVLGAYRHGRVAEWMLGGVTGSVLETTFIPLFLKQ
jgi:CrcB protein